MGLLSNANELLGDLAEANTEIVNNDVLGADGLLGDVPDLVEDALTDEEAGVIGGIMDGVTNVAEVMDGVIDDLI
ncbi:hypothetical protein [Ahrensia sp. 13_GOM-1096m]|uniref:hypothetical protein n=1 Tax=Ahrensia sp. 13_GOM-1096m TaxID=1380380 RepID=UPI00047CEA1C|nr:hypothetical protein [Ahrensia sp. 13_GOM-1096m]